MFFHYLVYFLNVNHEHSEFVIVYYLHEILQFVVPLYDLQLQNLFYQNHKNSFYNNTHLSLLNRILRNNFVSLLYITTKISVYFSIFFKIFSNI